MATYNIIGNQSDTFTINSLTAGVMRTDLNGLVSSSNGTNGQVLIGGLGDPAWANITSTGGTVTITNGAGTINLEAASFSWNDVTGAAQALAVDNGYAANRGAGNVAFTLPATAVFGEVIRITGVQNGWTVAQNANQQIHFGNQSTTAGAGGSLASTHARDTIEMVCVVAGASTEWNITSSIGNVTVT